MLCETTHRVVALSHDQINDNLSNFLPSLCLSLKTVTLGINLHTSLDQHWLLNTQDRGM